MDRTNKMNKPRQSKYKNKRTKISGKTFDSAIEARYYRYLNKMISIREVLSFERQVPFVVAESFEKEGRRFNAIRYYADFVVKYPDGHEEIIDVKGVLTDVFKIKRHLFEQRHPDKTIKLVQQNKDKQWIEIKK